MQCTVQRGLGKRTIAKMRAELKSFESRPMWLGTLREEVPWPLFCFLSFPLPALFFSLGLLSLQLMTMMIPLRQVNASQGALLRQSEFYRDIDLISRRRGDYHNWDLVLL